ncbi:MAG: lipoate--protein ligase family protein [Chloroflexi bacterium]|nr:lipoate--protein ligase family protein [Chloroflexota bacterium]
MTTERKIRLTTESFAHRPALDTAVSRAVLQRVSEGIEPETLRLFRPAAIVAFGPQDIRASGYQQAIAAARVGDFEAINRLVGGRAAVFHEDTLAFSWTIPDQNPRQNIEARFQEIADLIAAALRNLGVDARIGEVADEYCPGQYSVNARGSKKLMGVGQRIISKATHVGGVVVVGGSQRIRDVLVPVYQALQLDLEPSTIGSIGDELGATNFDDVRQAIVDEFASRYNLSNGALAPDTVALAETLESEHIAP